MGECQRFGLVLSNEQDQTISIPDWRLVMKAGLSPCPNHGDWKSLYRAAILETNKNALQQRVSEAERAVLARGRELFYSGGPREEQEALEDALYALRAFRSALEHAEAA
jgi:hypothetical protein